MKFINPKVGQDALIFNDGKAFGVQPITEVRRTFVRVGRVKFDYEGKRLTRKGGRHVMESPWTATNNLEEIQKASIP